MIEISQTKQCTASDITSKISNVEIDYGSSSSKKALTSYAEPSDFFTYTRTAVCGALTCELKATGCSNALTSAQSTKISMHGSTYAVSAQQNVDAGYTETVCLKCSNTHVSKTHDNW